MQQTLNLWKYLHPADVRADIIRPRALNERPYEFYRRVCVFAMPFMGNCCFLFPHPAVRLAPYALRSPDGGSRAVWRTAAERKDQDFEKVPGTLRFRTGDLPEWASPYKRSGPAADGYGR